MQQGSGVDSNRISGEYRGTVTFAIRQWVRDWVPQTKGGKLLHWFHFSIPCNDAPKHDKDRRRDFFFYVIILLQPESQVLLNLRTQFPNALCNSTLNSIFHHHISWRSSKTAMKDALPTSSSSCGCYPALCPSPPHPFHQHHYLGHHFPLLSYLRYRQHSTNPLPTNLMACSLARKCASLNSPTHLKYFSLFLLLPKCHQFSNTRGQSLQPFSPATSALHELILVRLPAVPTAFAGYL